ncbi:mechanosensitive ion channel family protein [Thermithiobacillus plumbiphilus]|uniref:Small-conductance mechanosensitive channel n=1 Tax=Thermithiobacillus plumbiphilus TaxID=1729899 RepID=A0ABU9D3W0_9PROT
MKQWLHRLLARLPLSSIVWAATAILLILILAIVEQHYKIPSAWATLARALIVIAIGLRIIKHIEGALAAERADTLSRVMNGQTARNRSLSWRDTVTGIYIIRLLLYAGLVLITIFAVGGTLSGFVVGGTLISVMLGVAGQSFFANFFGGLAIALFRPFDLGDHIQLIAGQLPIFMESYPHSTRPQGYSGIIRDINLFYTELRLDSGQILRVPNGIVITAGLLKTEPDEWVRLVFRFDIDVSLDTEATLNRLNDLARTHFCGGQDDDAEIVPLPTQHSASAQDQAGPLRPAKQIGWQPPEVAIVDLGVSTTSIEVRSSVPAHQSQRSKEAFLREAAGFLRAKPA